VFFNTITISVGFARSWLDHLELLTAKGEPFKFANEKTSDNDDVVELPNPLPLSRAIN
jgi:hypothetical protein